jgi:hypothetical protein
VGRRLELCSNLLSVVLMKDPAQRSGRSPDWLKMKISNAPAVKREAEEESGKREVKTMVMTIKVVLRGPISSQEILADTEQVQSKNNEFEVASGEEWFARTRMNLQ